MTTTPQDKEIIICAAILTGDHVLIKGHRHADCIATAKRMNITFDDVCNRIEGFITSKNRFVDRYEAHEIHFAKPGELYSEDLY